MIPRCSFFFANPNMAAVLFVQLAVLCRCGLARWPRLGAALTVLASLAVVLTGSRGGLVALAAGLLVGSFLRPTRRSALPRGRDALVAFRRRGVLAASCVLVLLAALYFSGLAGRFSAIPHDGSVANRLLLWRNVPRMMADAPGGWGLGHSGTAFVDWYQPLDRHEHYRTLVGSHQTLLVEFGTTGRCHYLLLWLLVLTLSVRHARRTGSAHAAAQFAALAVAATFSSVLEVWMLWLIPALSLIPIVRDRAAWRLPARVGAGVVLGALVPIFCIQAWCGSGDRWFENSGRVSRPVGADAVDNGRWFVPEARVVGAHWPRRIRAAKASVCTAATLDLVDTDATELIVCGAVRRLARERYPRLRKVVYLSPKFRPLACDPSFESVVVGEFAPDVPDPSPAGVTVVPGASDYLPPEALFGLLRKKRMDGSFVH